MANVQGRPRGFAAMAQEKQREIARKGGETVSRDREYMATIGRRGGKARAGGQDGAGRERGSDSE